MQLPEIVLAGHDNQVFEELQNQWIAQLESYALPSGDYATPYMQHAEAIVKQRSDPNYGIACVRSRTEGGYIALFHANRARLPGTIGETLRVLWVLPSPKYDLEEPRPAELAELSAGIIWGSMELAMGAMRSDEVKIHLQNVGDRKFVTAMAFSLRFTRPDIMVETRGNWLHISGLTCKG